MSSNALLWKKIQIGRGAAERSGRELVDPVQRTITRRPLPAAGVVALDDFRVLLGQVNGVGHTLEGVSALLRLFQTGFVGTYALFFTLGVAALLLHFLRHMP